MRKSAIVLSLALGFSTFAQSTVFAQAESVQNQPQSDSAPKAAATKQSANEYNELGIKKGTIVNGIDISKLDKKELQYVPEGWRDGTVPEHGEHREETTLPKVARSATYPDVNSYIKSNGFSAVSIQKDYKTNFPIMAYRFGKPEGVVAHETANNNSTINSEISYMTRNYKNAFVHGFVDASNVIEIHPTQYSVWGAGPYANARFIQVELVREKTFDRFARSINNYADYLATLLYKNNLTVTTAQPSGTGTLWSHNDVTKYLKGTTHTDPIGYFSTYGYTWNEFVTLVQEKYNRLAGENISQTAFKTEKTSRLGHIRSAKNWILKTPGVANGSFQAGETNTNRVYYIKQQAKVNDTLYYKISLSPSATKGVVGWMKASDMTTREHKVVDKDAKNYYVIGQGKAYTKAWGGKKDVVYNLADYQDQLFEVTLTERADDQIWYRGTLNGKTVWIRSSDVEERNIAEAKTSRLGHINSAKKKIYKTIAKESTAFAAGSKYTNTVYYIKKKAVYGGETYYLISQSPSSVRGVVGWMKAGDLSTREHKVVDKNAKTFHVKGRAKAYAKAWGGKKDVVYNLADYKGETFQVHLTERADSQVWYRGVLDGKTVWIHSSDVY